MLLRFCSQSSHWEEEYRYLTAIEYEASGDYKFSMHSFLQTIDTHLLKIIFLVLDAIIVIYRCSRIYMTAGTLCRGFEESINLKRLRKSRRQHHSDMKESELQNFRNQVRHMPPDDRGGDQTYLKDDQGLVDPSMMVEYSAGIPLDGPLQPKANSAMMSAIVRNDIGAVKHTLDDDDSDNPKWTQKKSDSCKHSIGKLLQSTLIPKLLISFVILLGFYIALSAACVVLDIQTLADFGVFRVFLAGLEAQVNQTNWYLNDQAKHFNEVTMNIYESQMRSELLHLQSMLEFFNNGRLKQIAFRKGNTRWIGKYGSSVMPFFRNVCCEISEQKYQTCPRSEIFGGVDLRSSRTDVGQ